VRLDREAAPRIAIVKLSSLGDVVHALPAAHAIRTWWPRAELTWVVERREQAILLGNPAIDHVVAVDTRLWRREFRRPAGAVQVLTKLRGLLRRLGEGRFDAALDLQGLWKSGVITALTRAPLRVGLAASHCRERANAWFTNRRVRPGPDATHVVERYLAVTAGLGVDLGAVGPPEFPIPADATSEAVVARWLEEEGVKPSAALVVLNPGSGGEGKRWTAEAFRRLGEELAVRLGARVAIAWGPGEEPLARAVAHGMRTGALVPPPTTIAEMIALFRRAILVVGGDTGPVHVAAVLGVPTVGLYGPTSARRNGPYGRRAATIQSPTGRMDGIAVDNVLAAAQRLLREPAVR
jgi:lipopolysaccharide heptosyltransferase I